MLIKRPQFSMLTDEEWIGLAQALDDFTSNKDLLPFPSQEMEQIFFDFLLGLSFPIAVDVGEQGSKRRAAFTLLSAMWQLRNG